LDGIGGVPLISRTRKVVESLTEVLFCPKSGRFYQLVDDSSQEGVWAAGD
jgi:hypothetical protein